MEKRPKVSLRAKQSNLAFDEIKSLEIASSFPPLAMPQSEEFFPKTAKFKTEGKRREHLDLPQAHLPGAAGLRSAADCGSCTPGLWGRRWLK